MSIQINISLTKNSRLAQTDFNNLIFGRTYADHMFLADYVDHQWQDFRIEPYAPLNLTPGNATLHYGQSIFEGLKAYRSQSGEVRVFRPDKNFERLNRSAKRMQMPEISSDIFFDGLKSLLKIDREWVPRVPGASLYIRPFMFSADEYIGIRPASSYKFIIFGCAVGSYYAKPLRVKIEEQYTRAVPGGTGAAKTAGNYAASLFPMAEAQRSGYDQLIWTDALTHQYVEESGTMNLMFVIDNCLVTPELGDTILAGVIRDSAIALAKSWGVKVEERRVSVSEVLASIQKGTLQEAFGVGTAAVVAPIKTIGFRGQDFDLPDQNEQSIAQRIAKDLSDLRYGLTPDVRNWMWGIDS